MITYNDDPTIFKFKVGDTIECSMGEAYVKDVGTTVMHTVATGKEPRVIRIENYTLYHIIEWDEDSGKYFTDGKRPADYCSIQPSYYTKWFVEHCMKYKLVANEV